MTTTGRALRREILRNARGALGRMGLTTALAGSTSVVRDATRYDMNTRATSDDAECYVRLGVRFTGTATAVGATTLTDATLTQFGSDNLIGMIVRMGSSHATITGLTSTSVVEFTGGWTGGTPALGAYVIDYAHVAKIQYINPANGDIEIDPVATDEVVANTPYELWRAWPDDVDAARDKALTTRCSQWRVKPLSGAKEIADWSTAAYAASTGGVFNATADDALAAFPFRFPSRSMVVTNTGVEGLISSEPLYVQAGQTYRVFGWVSVRSGTASVKIFDGTDYLTGLSLTDTRFTLRGWQAFEFTFTVPASTGVIYLEVGGDAATCIAEWAGVGILPEHETMFSHEDRVISEHDIGHYYAFTLPSSVTGAVSWHRIDGVRRTPAGAGTLAVFTSPPGSSPVYYAERHRYAALQSDYMTKADRTEGDMAETDCNVDYLCWATIVELLEPQAATLNGAMAGLFRDAMKNLHAWERRVGADPLIIPERTTHGHPIPVLTF